MKYIFNFELDYENRRTLAKRSIKVKKMRDYKTFYIYYSVHHNILLEITNRCNCMQ